MKPIVLVLNKKHTSQQAAGGEKFTIKQNGETKAKLYPLPTKAYRKNGILVRHAGKVISSETVANALAEE
jgi:antitoxin (DNA-binding transcriptional repressor) of toxin-antitoxin stability system